MCFLPTTEAVANAAIECLAPMHFCAKWYIIRNRLWGPYYTTTYYYYCYYYQRLLKYCWMLSLIVSVISLYTTIGFRVLATDYGPRLLDTSSGVEEARDTRGTLQIWIRFIRQGVDHYPWNKQTNMNAIWGNCLYCKAKNPHPIPLAHFLWPKHSLLATSSQIFRFLWCMPSLGVRSPLF